MIARLHHAPSIHFSHSNTCAPNLKSGRSTLSVSGGAQRRSLNAVIPLLTAMANSEYQPSARVRFSIANNSPASVMLALGKLDHLIHPELSNSHVNLIRCRSPLFEKIDYAIDVIRQQYVAAELVLPFRTSELEKCLQ